VVEIGSSLREARRRRGFELAQVAADTHIRTRYLKALEDERFDLLPGTAYVRGFLRTYAGYLGLEPELFVDEYNARFAPPEEPPPQLKPLRRLERHRLRVRATVGAGLAVAVVAMAAWRLDADDEPTAPAPPVGSAARTPPPSPGKTPARVRPEARPATLVLTATEGACWLSVRLGSRLGRRLYEGTVEQGESLRFGRKRLWIRLGAPSNLEASLNGEPAALPEDTASVTVASATIRTVEGD
jgi:Helix-turn-helix domain/RodZ C-terminal domain